jgi:hypothetical protein
MLARPPMNARVAFLITLVLSTVSWTSATDAGGLLDPSAYSSLGSLSVQSDLITIDTSGLLPVMTLSNGTSILGQFGGGSAVFDFSGIILTSDTLVVQGPWTLALLSRGDIIISGSSINVDGAGGFSSGGPGGGAQFTYGSGGGGGFGGTGGVGGTSVYGQPTPNPMIVPGGPGGTTYGGVAAPFFGGSAGGAGYATGTAGSGGGAIEIGALGNVNVNGTTITADGGSGSSASGGGSGGSISFLGNQVAISGSYLSAAGGNGGDGYSFGGFAGGYVGGGGGGGGGIIDIEANTFSSNAVYNLDGGYGGGGPSPGSGGGSGLLSLDPAAPEPTSIVLGSLAILAALGYRVIRH